MDKELTPNDYLQWWSDPITKELMAEAGDIANDATEELVTVNPENPIAIKGYQDKIIAMKWLIQWIDDKIKPQGGEDDSNG